MQRVLVLGSGVIGVSSAWYLANAGFEVTVVDAQIVLTPVRVERAGETSITAEAVRDKLAALGITPADLDDALAWARRD